MGSSPVAFKYFFFHLIFDLLVSLSLFLILYSTGNIYLNLACVYVTNAHVALNNFNRPTCDQLFAR